MVGVGAARPGRAWPYEGAWLIAFAVLVLNDHWLKGSGLLPGALTGKLSDFAGLFVAPVLLSGCSALFGWRGVRARVTWFAFLSVGFCAIKLNATAAGALEAVLGACGGPSRFWSDPTDLLALVVLPLAWRAARALEPTLDPKRRRVSHQLAIGLGALGCIATSTGRPYGYASSAYLVNLTPQDRPLTLLRVTTELDCSQLEAAALAADFAGEFCTTAGVELAVPLDRDFVGGYDGEGYRAATRVDPPCDAVVLRVPHLADTLLFWQTTPNQLGVGGTREQMIADPDAAVLEEAKGNLFATGSARLGVLPFPRTLPAIDCKTLPWQSQLDPGRAE